MSFTIALINVIQTILYIVPGVIVCKIGRAKPEHLSTVSGILVYACSPCMLVSSFVSLDYSFEKLCLMGLFFIVTLVLQVVFMCIIFFLFHKKQDKSEYRVLNIGSCFGNVGFFGLPIVKALLPNHPEALCYSSIFVVSMNILVFTAGIYFLTNKKDTMTLKAAIFNPTTLGPLIGIPLFILGGKNFLPSELMSCVSMLGSMTTPLCMLILGIRLATIPVKKLFSQPFVYLICLSKLIIFPLFCYGCVALFPLPFSFKASTLILAATPCASVILNMAEIYHSEESLSANCVLISTLMCFLTIPVLTLIL